PIFSLLQMLEKAPVKFVGRLQILLQKPFSIARHIVHGVELIAQKTWAHQTDAFLRQLCTDRMELPKVWCHPFETSKILRNGPDKPVLLRVGGPLRLHYLL